MKRRPTKEAIRCEIDMRTSDFDYVERASYNDKNRGPVSIIGLIRSGFTLLERDGGNLLIPSLNEEADEAARSTKLAYGGQLFRGKNRTTIAISMPPEEYMRIAAINGVLGYCFEEQTLVYSGMVIAKTIHDQA